MALQGWDKNYREELKIQQEVIESLQQQLMIAGEGGSPGQPYTPPTGPKPNEPYVPAPGRQKLAANNIRRTGKPLANDDDYGEGNVPGHPDWKLAHGEGRGPQPQYHDEYNRELPIPPWMQMDPSGKLIEIPWMKEQYLQEHPQAGLQISGMNYPPPTELDKWLQLYQRNGGSLRHLDPDLRRLILQRGAMKANLPANNIRRLKDTGHMTIPQNPDGTGPLRIIDLLGPQNPPQA